MGWGKNRHHFRVLSRGVCRYSPTTYRIFIENDKYLSVFLQFRSVSERRHCHGGRLPLETVSSIILSICEAIAPICHHFPPFFIHIYNNNKKNLLCLLIFPKDCCIIKSVMECLTHFANERQSKRMRHDREN